MQRCSRPTIPWDLPMTDNEPFWLKQCDAARGIKERFGLTAGGHQRIPLHDAHLRCSRTSPLAIWPSVKPLPRQQVKEPESGEQRTRAYERPTHPTHCDRMRGTPQVEGHSEFCNQWD